MADALSERCTVTTAWDGGILRCSLPAGHAGDHAADLVDGAALGWSA